MSILNKFMNYFIGIIWFLISLTISCINDVTAKYIHSNNLSSLEISFYRFFFGTLCLTPFVFYYGFKSIKTSHIQLHFLRGILLSLSIFLWINGLKYSQVATATIISFTIPIFVLILAPLILKEPVTLKLWIVTLISLVGIFITILPYDINFNSDSYLFVIAALLFATLDVINKKYITKETMLCMLFYSSLFTTLILFIPLFNNLKIPKKIDIFYLILLGIGSNFILFCILKAFNLVKASILAPLRYLELIFSILLGYFIFDDIPDYHIFIGASIIIPISLYVILKFR